MLEFLRGPIDVDISFIEKIELERWAFGYISDPSKRIIPRDWMPLINEYDNSGDMPDIFIPYPGINDPITMDFYSAHIFWSQDFGQEVYYYADPIIEEWEKNCKLSKGNEILKFEDLMHRLFDDEDYDVTIFTPYTKGNIYAF